MQAVVIHAPGGPEQLTLAELPHPIAGPGEVLVDVAFAGCNWADTQIRTGLYPHPVTYPLVLGFEIAGTVAALGPGVAGVNVGDRVATLVERGGAYAEKCAVPAAGLISLPDAIALDVAAAFPIQALTAYHMLYTVFGIEPGDTVLINAIGGGVGLFCTQLAVRAGARVIGTVGTPGKEKRALDYGAARVVLRHEQDFEWAVLDFTGGKGVDLAIDSLGATTLDRTFNVVRKLGHGPVSTLGVVRPQLTLAGVDRWRDEISVRSQSRACRCRRRSELGAEDRRRVATNASTVISPFGGSAKSLGWAIRSRTSVRSMIMCS